MQEEQPASNEYSEHHESRRRREAGSCICDTVAAIKEAQDEADDNNGRNCRNRCVDSLLSPNGNNNGLDTIPFVLQNKKGHYFSATGGIGTNDCFQTVFFRVERLDKDSCCATLSMLLPDCDLDFDKCCVDPMSLCDIDALERTRHCIEVDLDCFCAIQCLDPNLVGDIDNHHRHR
ncbi:spore coat protein [Salibacterium salarium]|uniref:Spore coat protein n=2 Tax=Salibacterium salarium TaxID=284579 RepID=A0A428N0K1_9BACI|nr:spore coat protein [Salibacterium salarium]